jgi:hypothetical protein
MAPEKQICLTGTHSSINEHFSMAMSNCKRLHMAQNMKQIGEIVINQYIYIYLAETDIEGKRHDLMGIVQYGWQYVVLLPL